MTQDELQDLLRTLAQASPREPRVSTEDQLRAAFRARQKRVPRLLLYAACCAAALVLIAAGSFLAERHRAHGQAPLSYEMAPGFILLPYAESGVPIEQPVVVRMTIPTSELPVIGLPAPPTALSNPTPVTADVLMGQDGVPRAVRFVSQVQ